MFAPETLAACIRQVISSSPVDAATRSRVEANAGLIAAAPELLSALEPILAIPADDNGERIIPPGFLDEARAAINKAKGTQ